MYTLRMRYTIQNGEISAVIDSLGAEAVSVVCRGRERLWQNESGSWAGHAPLLFPYCGKCGVTVAGKTYELQPHGFARKCEFTLTYRSASEIEFTLGASEHSRKFYPYDFVFTVRYTVKGDTLAVKYTVKNPSDEAIYFSCGGHDSFALRGGVENYAVIFDEDEGFVSLVHDEDGRLTGEKIDLGKGKRLALSTEYLKAENTLIFGGINSRKVTLESVAGEKEAEVTFEGFGNLLLWHSDPSDMICIEPWLNLPDCSGGDPTEFSSKASIRKIEPGKVTELVRSIKYY